MLQIRNIAKYGCSVKTTGGGGTARPMVINLMPDEHLYMMQAQLTAWPMEAKQDLASYVSSGILSVKELAASHVAPDKSENLTFVSKTVGGDKFTSLEEYVVYHANIWKSEYNAHVITTAFHTVAGAGLATANATNLATAITLITALRVAYNAHIIAGAQHPNADANNAVSTPVLVTEVNCMDALEQFVDKFSTHKQWLIPAASTDLTPSAIITY